MLIKNITVLQLLPVVLDCKVVFMLTSVKRRCECSAVCYVVVLLLYGIIVSVRHTIFFLQFLAKLLTFSPVTYAYSLFVHDFQEFTSRKK